MSAPRGRPRNSHTADGARFRAVLAARFARRAHDDFLHRRLPTDDRSSRAGWITRSPACPLGERPVSRTLACASPVARSLRVTSHDAHAERIRCCQRLRPTRAPRLAYLVQRPRRCRRIRLTSPRSVRASSPSARSFPRGRGSGARSFLRGRYSVSPLRSPPGCAA